MDYFSQSNRRNIGVSILKGKRVLSTIYCEELNAEKLKLKEAAFSGNISKVRNNYLSNNLDFL